MLILERTCVKEYVCIVCNTLVTIKDCSELDEMPGQINLDEFELVDLLEQHDTLDVLLCIISGTVPGEGREYW